MATVTSEIVYTTKEEGHVMSDKVSQLASMVYTEFKRIIQKYDEDVVKELMPLVIGILENLDLAYLGNQEIDVELELIKEDNEQLLTQYEREKQLRKASDQKYLELEDETLDYRNEIEEKVESLESIVRMLEQKNKNVTDQLSRLEEKESEMKTEYNRVHDRYTELMRTHMDYMERAKFLMGPDRITEMLNNTRARSVLHSPNQRSLNMANFTSGENFTSAWCPPDANEFDSMFLRTDQECNFSKNELCDLEDSLHINSNSGTQVVLVTETSDKEQDTDFLDVRESATSLDRTIAHIVETTPELEQIDESMEISVSTNNGSPKTNDMSIYDELNMRDLGDVDYGPDINENDEDTDERHSTGSDIFYGMSRELENLIHENTELLTTKNALNVVKDDLIATVDELTSEQKIFKEEIISLKLVKDKLQSRIQSLEEELKKTKEKLEEKTQVQEAENEDDVPMAQRKRFTRVEMARVIMERNQYKERLMELQEDVRWTEMIRANKEHPETKSSIWNFFSNLFSSPHQPTKNSMVKYSTPAINVQPVGDPKQTNRDKYNLGDKSEVFDFLQNELTSEKAKEQENERREQSKQVCAHVKKDGDRMQACGWSLPSKFQLQVPNASQFKSSIRVPVPVYSGSLLEGESGIKILCATGINLTGGRRKDASSIIGAGMFYSNPLEMDNNKKTEVNKVDPLDQELKDHEYNIKQSEQEHLSSFVWICTSGQSGSCVSVIDFNHPGEILETFRASTTPILCIATVPGALESDYPVNEIILKAESHPQYPQPMTDTYMDSSKDGVGKTGIGVLSFVQCATGSMERSNPMSPVGSPTRSRDVSPSRINITDSVFDELSRYDAKTSQPIVFKSRLSPPLSATATSESSGGIMSRRLINPPLEMVRDGINALASGSCIQDEEVEMSSVLPTVWLGAHSGSLYIHPSASQWRRCLHSVKLQESILHIVHVKGRVLVALADGSVAIFHRDTDGQWDVHNYHLLDLERLHHPIGCVTVIANRHVWCGYRNKIHVLDPQSMSILKSFDAHPRKESQVRQLAWVGDGVWVSIRLDSTLRLYHAYTYQHLQDVDIEPYVSKMLGTGKLGFSFVRITSMLISCKHLWIGTGNGVIISVPLSEGNIQRVSVVMSGSVQTGGIVRLHSDRNTDSVTPASFIPFCSMAQAQLSFHGHRDAVKFFVAVPGKKRRGTCTISANEDNNLCGVPNIEQNIRQLVISGGEGYVDLRVGDGDDDAIGDSGKKKTSLSKGDRSHLIVWQVS